MQPPVHPDTPDAEYISNRLFTNAIVYGLPIALFVLISNAFINLRVGNTFLTTFGAIILSVVCISSLNASISMPNRKLIASGALTVMGIILIALRGSHGIGCIYLLTSSIFYALHFSDKFARRGVWLNILICCGFILAVYFKLLPDSVLNAVPLKRWITYSINFLFLNVLVVIMIRQTINRLERALKMEATLHQELKTQNEKLKDIAFVQSHSIRLPLTKIMALTDLIENEYKGVIDQELMSSLTHSSNELDSMIRKIVSESETILTEFGSASE